MGIEWCPRESQTEFRESVFFRLIKPFGQYLIRLLAHGILLTLKEPAVTKIGYRYENSEIIPNQARTSNCQENEVFYACSCFCN